MKLYEALIFLTSFAIFVAGATGFYRTRHTQKLTQRLLMMTIAVIVAMFFARLGMSICGMEPLTPAICVEIMQAFSLDAEYDILTKVQLDEGWQAFAVGLLAYLAVLYTTAPIIGGAIVYDVLAGVSPSIRLWFMRRKPVFVFSEINEASVTLAESISRHNARAGQRAAIVFSDNDSEDDDLLMRINDIGGIRLKEDVHHVNLRHARKCSLFLMRMRGGDDFDEEKNLTDLYSLLNEKRAFSRNPDVDAEMFFFSNDSEMIECVRDIKRRYDDKRKAEKEDMTSGEDEKTPRKGAVLVNVIRPHAQAACSQLKNAPLFQPLGEYTPGKKLRVAIFGDSPFAREVFKTAFWCGQMLGIELYISVIYMPDEKSGVPEYEAWLNRLSPEIIQSCTWTTEGTPPECLRISAGSDGRSAFAKPYCALSFIEEDPRSANLRKLMTSERRYMYGCQDTYRLCDCDCFFIMGGDDQENLSLASSIRTTLVYGDAAKSRTDKKAPQMSIEIRSAELQEILIKRFENTSGADTPTIVPFGSYRERYRWENVFLKEEYLATEKAGESVATEGHGFEDITQTNDNIYDTWSEIGRCFHTVYREYCGRPDGNMDAGEREALIHRLAWLEHRRWNAFLRMQGFTRPFDRIDDVIDDLRVKTQAGNTPLRRYGYKNVSGRLHPCLVECFQWDTHPETQLENCLNGLPVSFEGLDAMDVISMVRTRLDGTKQNRINNAKKYDLELSRKQLEGKA